LEDGGTVDLTPFLDNTDDQALSLAAGNILTLEDGGTVDLTPFLDNTDDQAITAFSLDNATNVLTITLENGGTQTVDLSNLDNAGTDDQALSLAAGNILTLEDGGTVDLTPFLDNTDDQAITAFSLDNATNVLTITLENGGTQTVDLSNLDNAGTDDQTATEVAITDAAGNFTSTDVEGALAELATNSTDDQFDDEVNLRTPIDVDEGGEASPTAETNVQEVIQAIAPITSKAARIFYPPSITVDASINGTFSIDLHAQYMAQFGSPTVGSAGAPAALPTYTATELYYYVTYADPTVFNTATMSIDVNGVLSYEIIGQPADYNSLINVVFVVK
ncbi:hypothetical protein, partial [Flavobacterium sp. ASW18X]|uniref:hypothetical protein n=1 Tax=Flavobacterium sp. ASW18X TaxID=2572595 RepID=UPI00146DED24